MNAPKKGDEDMAKEPKEKRGPGRREIALPRPSEIWSGMDRMFEDFHQEMEEFFTRPRWWLPGGFGFPVRRPAVNIRDEGKALVVIAELPGVAKEDVDLNITDDSVEIRAEARKETEEKREGYVRRERSERAFHRYVTLPAAVDPDHAEARLENGILQIELPKRVPTRARKVEVG